MTNKKQETLATAFSLSLENTKIISATLNLENVIDVYYSVDLCVLDKVVEELSSLKAFVKYNNVCWKITTLTVHIDYDNISKTSVRVTFRKLFDL